MKWEEVAAEFAEQPVFSELLCNWSNQASKSPYILLVTSNIDAVASVQILLQIQDIPLILLLCDCQ